MNWPPGFLEMGISKFISSDVPTLPLTASVEQAVTALKGTPHSVVLLTDPAGRLAGILAESDLGKLSREAERPTNAAELGTTSGLIAIKQSAQLWQLLKIMNGENTSRRWLSVLPVVDEERKPVGIVRREPFRVMLATELNTVQAGALRSV